MNADIEGVKISALPKASSVSDTDVVAGVVNGTTSQIPTNLLNNKEAIASLTEQVNQATTEINSLDARVETVEDTLDDDQLASAIEKVESLANIKSVGDGLSLADDGTLSATGGGGGGSTEIAEAYGDSSTTALSQKFLSGILNATEIVLGRVASAQNYGVAVGESAKTTQGRNVALGNQANASGYYTAAIGSNSKANRRSEVSFGDGSDNADYGTRFLANVRAGENDTDAVNFKQFNDAVGDITTVLARLSDGAGV